MRNIAATALLALLAISSASADEVTSYDRRPDLPPLKSTSIEVNPLGLYAQANFGVSDHMTIGPSVSLLRWSLGFLSDTTVRGYTAGIQSVIYLTSPRFTDGWIFQPSFGYYTYDMTVSYPDFFGGNSSSYYGKFHGLYTSAVAGYQWVWDDGFTMSLGAGATYYSLGKNQVLGPTGGTTDSLSENTFYGGVNAAIMLNIGVVL